MIQYLNYESVFYGWKGCLIPWSLFNLVYGLVLVGGSIAYIVISQGLTEDDQKEQWDSLSTYGGTFYDNEKGNLLKLYKTNMLCICIFALVEGVLYVFEFLLMFIYMIMLPKGWKPIVRSGMPTKTKSGINKLEEQPYGSILPNGGKTIGRKKKQGGKPGEKEEIEAGGIEALREDEEM